MARITLILTVITAVIGLLGGFQLVLHEWRLMRERRRVTGRWFVLLLCLGLWLSLSSVAQATSWPAASCNPSAVQAVHDAGTTVAGDTILIPAGSCHWATGVSITKAVTITGATACTLQTVSNSGLSIQVPSSCPTVIIDDTSASLFIVTLAANATTTLGELQFTQGTGVSDGATPLLAFKGGPFNPTTDARRLRVYHVMTNVPRIYMSTNDILGVLDHNNFITDTHAFHYNANWNNTASDYCWLFLQPLACWGDLSYADISRFGTEYALFEENNYFQCTNGHYTFNDGWSGMRLVIRYNIASKCVPGGHGTESGGRVRSMRVMDVYNNVFDMTAGPTLNVLTGYRGGTGVIFNNVGVGFVSPGIPMSADRLRTAFKPFGCGVEGPTNNWDLYPTSGNPFYTGTANGASSGLTVTVSGSPGWTTDQWVGYSIKNTTIPTNDRTVNQKCMDTATGTHPNFSMITGNTTNTITYSDSGGFNANLIFRNADAIQIFKVSKVLDQPGRVMGTAVVNDASNNYDTPNPPWTTNDQVQDPIYCWNNVQGATPILCTSSFYSVVEGVDFINSTKPGYVAYTYPHPLTGSVAPPPPVTRFYLRFAEVLLLIVSLAWKLRAPLITGVMVLISASATGYQHARLALPEAAQRTTYATKVLAAKVIHATVLRRDD